MSDKENLGSTYKNRPEKLKGSAFGKVNTANWHPLDYNLTVAHLWHHPLNPRHGKLKQVGMVTADFLKNNPPNRCAL